MSALANKRIVVTRAAHQAGELEQLLRERGATPLLYPCIEINPPQDSRHLYGLLRSALDGAFDWLVLTSTNTVRVLRQSFDEMYPELSPASDGGSRVNLKVAAVGAATAHYAIEELGLHVSVIPEHYSANGLADSLALEKGSRVLLPQSEIAEPMLATTLAHMGAIVTTVTAYQTVIGSGGIDLPALLERGEVDAITLTSGSTVTHLLQRLQNDGGDALNLANVCMACIGTSTATTAHKNNLPVTVMPEKPTLQGLVTALEHHYAEEAIGESKEC